MRRCTDCGEVKPLTSEYFRERKTCKTGFSGQCKVCIAKYRKQYSEKNKKPNVEYQRKYNEEHKEKYRQYYLDHKEAYQKRSNQPANRAYAKQYYHDHKESFLEYHRQYRRKNNEKFRVYCQRRRSKIREIPATLTIQQWENVKLYFGNTCAYCGKDAPLTQDHFVPLIIGGEYSHNNIIPACSSCNLSKNKKEFYLWFPTYKHYSKQRESKILKYLSYTKGVQQLSLM